MRLFSTGVGLAGMMAGLVANANGEIVISTLNATPTAFVGGGIGLEPGPRVNLYSMGQSLTAPVGATTLHEFSFIVAHQDFIPPGSPWGLEVPLSVRGVVMQFAGSTAVGAPLFISDVFSVPLGSFTNQLVTVETGDLPVTQGQQYGLILSIIGVTQSGYNRVLLPLAGNLVGGPGGASTDRVIASNASTFTAAAGSTWISHAAGASIDTLFEARFNVIPAMPTALMGLLGICAGTRRRRA